MRCKRLLCVLLLSTLAAAGCAYEKKVAVSCVEPDWMTQPPVNTIDRLVFVGQGLGDNIVDTRRASERAMQDVRNQIAKSLESRAVALAIEIVGDKGIAHESMDKERATHSALIGQQVDAAMPGVQQDAIYWEKWMVKPGLMRASYSKYVYYVKASIAKDQFEKLVTDVANQIAGEIAARAQQATTPQPSPAEGTTPAP